MKKEKDFAYFVPSPRNLQALRRPYDPADAKPFRVVRSVGLKAIDYENFCEDMTVERAFLPEAAPQAPALLFRFCVLVYARKHPEDGGVLVCPAPDGYVAQAAFVPEVKKRWMVSDES